MHQPLSPETLAAIRAMIAGGNKIEAIKLLREATGLDLAQASAAVDTLATGPGGTVELPQPYARPTDVTFPAVRASLAAGRTIEAIKFYREATGCSLAEAKAAVDQMAMETDHPAPADVPSPPHPASLPSNEATRPGCLGLLLAGAIPMGASALWLATRLA